MGKHQALGTSRWKQLRLRILMRDGYECAYCGETADTVDHVISRASGGDMWDAENLVAACKRCNSMKGDRPAKKAVFSGGSNIYYIPFYTYITSSLNVGEWCSQ